mmetsp:Transcript_65667/g.104630  ORF Transcript_65667/g.104630 Transcript_65667/m.104630 type:complete len:361 (-) Transcript_65667:375-1457(-)
MPCSNRSYNKPHSNVNRAENIKTVLKSNGFHSTQKIAQTLQGQIWRATHPDSDAPFVIKVTSKTLHKEGLTVRTRDGKKYVVDENIVKEASIIEHLNSLRKCPPSIIGYHGCFHSDKHYYLLLQHGGTPLFDFVATAHELIHENHLQIAHWMKVVRIAFKQMMDAIHFMHSQNIIHYDVSIENMTMFNEPDIDVCAEQSESRRDSDDGDMQQDVKLQIKLIDFGLAERFIVDEHEQKPSSVSTKFVGKRNYQCPEIREGKAFDAAANDIWCLGVCLFMMATGSHPWEVAEKSDTNFKLIYKHHRLKHVLNVWNRAQYVDDDLLHLMQSMFKPQSDRISMAQIQSHAWLSGDDVEHAEMKQ